MGDLWSMGPAVSEKCSMSGQEVDTSKGYTCTEDPHKVIQRLENMGPQLTGDPLGVNLTGYCLGALTTSCNPTTRA